MYSLAPFFRIRSIFPTLWLSLSFKKYLVLVLAADTGDPIMMIEGEKTGFLILSRWVTDVGRLKCTLAG